MIRGAKNPTWRERERKEREGWAKDPRERTSGKMVWSERKQVDEGVQLAVTWCDSTREALNVKQGTIKEGEQRATAKVINDNEKGGHYGLGKCPCKSNVHDSTSEEGVDGRR